MKTTVNCGIREIVGTSCASLKRLFSFSKLPFQRKPIPVVLCLGVSQNNGLSALQRTITLQGDYASDMCFVFFHRERSLFLF